MISVEQQLATIKRGVVDLIEEAELALKLKQGKPLTIKAGFDPTAVDLHLGHAVLLAKMRQFQDMGHRVVFLIGDFTARIGDPSGRSKTRPPLSELEIAQNVKTYKEQVFKILDPKKTEVRFNSEWLSKLGAEGMIRLAGQYTLARMLERDDFSQRFKNHQPLSLHEFLYPLLQGWDSVVLKADVELGGQDQIFNLLMGRQLQKEEGIPPQVVITLPLLVGIDGQKKMSKSYNNSIGIQDSPRDIYGKIMSISDDLMWSYYELISRLKMSAIKDLREQVQGGREHPKKIKAALAKEIVGRFHSEKEANAAEVEFDKIFKKGGVPDEIVETKLKKSAQKSIVANLIATAGLSKSRGEARRLMVQGGVSVNGIRVTDSAAEIESTGEYLVQVGKRKFIRFIFH